MRHYRRPDICHGRAYIKGLRVTSSVILASQASDLSLDEILASYPTVPAGSFAAALAYAADLARE